MGGKRVKVVSDTLDPYNVCCFGVDYIGVITCCVMAYMCPRVKITVVDSRPEKVSLWNTKQFPSNEPGLEDILKKVQNKNLVFTDDCVRAIKGTDLIFLSVDVSPPKVPTDDGAEARGPNFTEIEKAVRFISENSQTNKIIVAKSANSIGNCDFIKNILNSSAHAHSFEVLSNPDFFSEGTAINDLMNPDRIVIGHERTPSGLAAAKSLATLYAEWVPRKKILTVDVWSSELSKVYVNAFLAQKLSSMNAIALLCENTNADVSQVYETLKNFSEHGSECMKPTFGVGGDSPRKDLMCLIYLCERWGLAKEAHYWRQSLEFNKFHEEHFMKKILFTFLNTLTQKKVAVWGVTYRKFTPFTSEFPALDICRKLLEEGAKIEIYDPRVEKKQILQELSASNVGNERERSVKVGDTPYQVAAKAHAIICLTDLEELLDLNYEMIYKDMLKPAYIFDGRLTLPYEKLTKIGFRVSTIGRENIVE